LPAVSKNESTNTIGSAQLMTVWADPDFDAAVPAFFYLHVFEIPMPHNVDPRRQGPQYRPTEGLP
jgi:hypothetical protein